MTDEEKVALGKVLCEDYHDGCKNCSINLEGYCSVEDDVDMIATAGYCKESTLLKESLQRIVDNMLALKLSNNSAEAVFGNNCINSCIREVLHEAHNHGIKLDFS